MNARPLRLEIIIGSVRVGRIAPVVASWFTEIARTHGEFDVGVLDLQECSIPSNLDDTAVDFRQRIAAADAFVAVTPEYNHGYPAPLKAAFDSLKYEWRAKPLGFVSYGGPAGGVRAVEQLRQVAAELHMVTVRQSVSFPQVHRAFDDIGAPNDPIAADAAPRMLGQLQWWASASRQWKSGTPYPG